MKNILSFKKNLQRIGLIAMAAVLAATTVQPTVYAQLGIDDYATNGVDFYDATDSLPCTGASGTGPATTSVDGADNAEKIYNYLVGKGLSGAQAAGILGNLQQESQFNPRIIQGSPPQIADDNYTPVNGVGFGLAQWTFTVRQQPLVDLARSTNRKIVDLTVQLDYLWQELNGSHKYALTSLKAASTPEDAAYIFHRDFEGSADTEATVIEKRGGPARTWYEKFDGGSDTGTDVNGDPAANSGDNIRCGAGNGDGDYTDDGFVLYNQCDAPWGQMSVPSPDGTACQVACGPTALAMIITNMTGEKVDPTATIKYTSDNNLWTGQLGTTPQAMVQLGANWNVRGENIPMNDFAGIRNAIKNGGLVLIMGRGAEPFLESVNHWVVIRGITEDGQVMIADPNGKSGNYNYNQVIGDAYDAWAYY